jgi:chromosomal replication initiation ATPase DnaA
LEQVIDGICSTFQLTKAELCAPGKAQPAAKARGVAAFFVRNSNNLSLSELAGFLDRDLSGLSQAALRIERRSGKDDLLCQKLKTVSAMLGITVC